MKRAFNPLPATMVFRDWGTGGSGDYASWQWPAMILGQRLNIINAPPLGGGFHPDVPRMISLTSSAPGPVLCVRLEGTGPEVTRLKRMGICTGRQLEIIQNGDPMILRVAGTRIGVSKQLARSVIVEAISSEGSEQATPSGEQRDTRQ